MVLLVLALLLLDAAAVVRAVDDQPSHLSRMNGMLIYSLALSQVCLVGMWAGLGRTSTAVRLPIAVASLAAWGQLIRVLLAPKNLGISQIHYWDVAHFTSIAGYVAIVYGISRTVGSTEMIRIGTPTDGARIAVTSRRFQFTISEMLQATAGCGASLAIVKFFYPPIERLPGPVLGVHFAYIGLFAFTGQIAAWAVLHSSFRPWRLGVLGGATWLMLLAFEVATNQQSWLIDEVGICIWPYLTLVTGALYACRVCGYRIVGKHTDRVALASAVGRCERDSTAK